MRFSFVRPKPEDEADKPEATGAADAPVIIDVQAEVAEDPALSLEAAPQEVEQYWAALRGAPFDRDDPNADLDPDLRVLSSPSPPREPEWGERWRDEPVADDPEAAFDGWDDTETEAETEAAPPEPAADGHHAPWTQPDWRSPDDPSEPESWAAEADATDPPPDDEWSPGADAAAPSTRAEALAVALSRSWDAVNVESVTPESDNDTLDDGVLDDDAFEDAVTDLDAPPSANPTPENADLAETDAAEWRARRSARRLIAPWASFRDDTAIESPEEPAPPETPADPEPSSFERSVLGRRAPPPAPVEPTPVAPTSAPEPEAFVAPPAHRPLIQHALQPPVEDTAPPVDDRSERGRGSIFPSIMPSLSLGDTEEGFGDPSAPARDTAASDGVEDDWRRESALQDADPDMSAAEDEDWEAEPRHAPFAAVDEDVPLEPAQASRYGYSEIDRAPADLDDAYDDAPEPDEGDPAHPTDADATAEAHARSDAVSGDDLAYDDDGSDDGGAQRDGPDEDGSSSLDRFVSAFGLAVEEDQIEFEPAPEPGMSPIAPPRPATRANPVHHLIGEHLPAFARPLPQQPTPPSSDAPSAPPAQKPAAPSKRSKSVGTQTATPAPAGPDRAPEQQEKGSSVKSEAYDPEPMVAPDEEAVEHPIALRREAPPMAPADDTHESGAAAVAPPMDEQVRMVEAMLFGSDKPLSTAELGARMPIGCDPAVAVRRLEEAFVTRGVRVVRVAGKWAFRTAPDLAYLMATESVESRKLSKAAIETLAIVAYHQPVTRAEIEEIRQVSVSKGTLDLLMELEWIKLGRRRQSPGRPVTFITTDEFLDHFGLESTKDLPGLDELRQAGLLDNRPPPAGPLLGGDPNAEYDDEDPDDEDDDPNNRQEVLM